MASAAITRSSVIQCCCGSKDCAFLAHNTTLLEGLERDVTRAAQLGQALLVRHETYVADSERDRRQMMATIEALEREKLELEHRNAQTIKENRNLLNQLEQLNDTVAESDGQIQALATTLQSTEGEIERLSALASRTQDLERQLVELEREQTQLHHSLETKTIDERTAVQRWKRAEITIAHLQYQIDRIEKEAREERDRHVEIVMRMERRMAVDAELATAAARVKVGKVNSGDVATGTVSVVSHFVKDILLDNANLQHGILELREMLMNSNEEVERLREHLRTHQPIPQTEQEHATPSLQAELENETVGEPVEPVVNQELHIHHHYHGPAPKKEVGPSRVQPYRRAKKKRQVLTSGRSTPSVRPGLHSASAAGTILAQTSVTVPPNPNRWSNATTLAPSSVPSSPLSSSYQHPSIYDRVFSDVAYDSSRPTSPSESIGSGSPQFMPSSLKKVDVKGVKLPSIAPFRSVSTHLSLQTKSAPATAIVSLASPQESSDIFISSPSLHSAIPEENEEISENNSLASPMFSPNLQPRCPGVRRTASHESLISVSGMDIHTLQSRPSQLFYSTSPRFASPSSGTSSDPVLTAWTATATVTASMSRTERDGGALSRSILHGSLAGQRRVESERRGRGFGKKVGGWVFGKWGTDLGGRSKDDSVPPKAVSVDDNENISMLPNTDSGGGSKDIPILPKPVLLNPSKTSPASSAPKRPTIAPKTGNIPIRLRPSGINQTGPIWGFFDAIPETPSQLEPTVLDEDALNESLQEL
ncbi:hypothetical protein GQ43DRAFT_458585 [Delitschia confertaspora ATCC 74209]|uniref:Uncharacterized protein n=1 Tax=Delitschia confertaspora ATCC 74209 TaxID=1513339 RepID=A0A9P4JHK1_9PLEO|nr:hypothetical protein GQ43DRAFT_458585 [Delitschia confertaspora ATCC 74209]